MCLAPHSECPPSEQVPIPVIEFVTGSGTVLNMSNSTALVENVHGVRMHRNNGTLSIVFPEGRAMRLSEVFGDPSTVASSRFLLRNLMIDLRPPGAGSSFQLEPVDLVYYLHFSELEPVLGDEDPSGGRGGQQ